MCVRLRHIETLGVGWADGEHRALVHHHLETSALQQRRPAKEWKEHGGALGALYSPMLEVTLHHHSPHAVEQTCCHLSSSDCKDVICDLH